MSLWSWLMEDQPLHAARWINLCSAFGIWVICWRIEKLEEAVKTLKGSKK